MRSRFTCHGLGICRGAHARVAACSGTRNCFCRKGGEDCIGSALEWASRDSGHEARADRRSNINLAVHGLLLTEPNVVKFRSRRVHYKTLEPPRAGRDVLMVSRLATMPHLAKISLPWTGVKPYSTLQSIELLSDDWAQFHGSIPHGAHPKGRDRCTQKCSRSCVPRICDLWRGSQKVFRCRLVANGTMAVVTSEQR